MQNKLAGRKRIPFALPSSLSALYTDIVCGTLDEGVIKLLRADLESRTGELSEARDTISTLNTEQQKAFSRIDHLTSELNSTRSSAHQDKQKLRDRLEEALLDAVEREQSLLKQNETSMQKWSNALLESKNAENKLEMDIRELRNLKQVKEEEINQ